MEPRGCGGVLPEPCGAVPGAGAGSTLTTPAPTTQRSEKRNQVRCLFKTHRKTEENCYQRIPFLQFYVISKKVRFNSSSLGTVYLWSIERR